MPVNQLNAKPKYRAYTAKNINTIPQFKTLTSEQRMAISAVSKVLPFRVNNYVVEELIDWTNIPMDPMFQLTFPQEGMLTDEDFERIHGLGQREASGEEIAEAVLEIRRRMNPHPAGQMEQNVPVMDGQPQQGMQHKYRETVLFFPSQGQTCHAYCTYCFRWAQFVGMDELKFANNEGTSLARYLHKHNEVRDVLFTGGDPLIMRTSVLRRYIKPLLKIDSLHSIRIGTKALAWWPYRFVTDSDADDLLRLFEEVQAAGKHLAFMAHYSHPREMSTTISETAVRRILNTGATIRAQAPLIRNVNDCPDIWAAMWQKQVDLGIIPYYMFVERDTGPKQYFDVPLYRALDIFTRAVRQVSGLGRTVRGPSMSCTPGKVLVDGVAEVNGQKVFVLKFIQGRDPHWTNRMFFAKYDEKASWIDHLEPAFEDRFFFEDHVQENRRWKHFTVYAGARGQAANTSVDRTPFKR
jgi:KamA family protein